MQATTYHGGKKEQNEQTSKQRQKMNFFLKQK